MAQPKIARARPQTQRRILGVGWRRALDIPDGRVENTWENRLKVASVIRETQPARRDSALLEGTASGSLHCSVLGYEACFLAGLAKLALTSSARSALLTPHRPFKIIYATLYYDVRPTFVVDISEQFEAEVRFHPRLQVTVQRSGSGQRSLPCPRRNSRARGRDGAILRHAGRRDLCRAFSAERSRASRGSCWRFPSSRSNRQNASVLIHGPRRYAKATWCRSFLRAPVVPSVLRG